MIRLLLVIGILLLIGQLLWMTRELAPDISSWLAQKQAWFALWRSALLVGLIAGWPVWVGWLAQRYVWSVEKYALVVAQRWRVAIWLIVLELVLVQGVAFRFIQEVMS